MKQILVIAVLAMAVLPSAFGQSDSKKTTPNEPGRHVTLLNQSFGEAQVQRDIAKLDRLLAGDFTLMDCTVKCGAHPLRKGKPIDSPSATDVHSMRQTIDTLEFSRTNAPYSSINPVSCPRPG